VVVVNREFERQLLAGEEAVGRRITFAFVPDQAMEVVGVVGNELVGEIDAAPRPVVYFPQAQDGGMNASLVVRSTSAPGPLLTALRREARALEPDVLVTRPATMDEVRAGSRAIFLRRFTLALVGASAAAALLLAMVGVYGVMSYSVTQRRDEIGVRMAMGARPGAVLGMVLRQGLVLALSGVTVGTVLALFATRSLARVLFETLPSDPLILVLAAALLAAVAVLACVVPASRAARVDPARVLAR
jgi:predicted lysophospholipase L1 biosynthesis ABC-type transport system permease subunit